MSRDCTEERFRRLLLELVDENPFAIRALLKILDTVFTTAVPTLAVTCEDRPRLLVNPDFVRANCATDDEVKAAICHEFLHVLLRHTETRTELTPAQHIAADAVINAIIHREHGPGYSSLFSRYYGNATDLLKLLRPMDADELAWRKANPETLPGWARAWGALYDGKLVADDIEALAEEIERASERGPGGPSGRWPFKLDARGGSLVVLIGDLLGDHDGVGGPLPDGLREALEEALKQMNGSGIWRSPRDRGVGANACEALFASRDDPLRRWQRKTLEVLRRHLTPDRQSRARRVVANDYRVPVLSPRDRRAFLRAQWAPFLPDAAWTGEVKKSDGTAQVYLDVSGSMNAEMPHIVALLARLGRHVRRPLWAFSDVVKPAVIERGLLRTQTTGGTSMACVLDHLALTRPEAVVVVTDGYIEQLSPQAFARAAGTRLHVLVTRDGNPAEILRAGLPYTQLDEVPE